MGPFSIYLFLPRNIVKKLDRRGKLSIVVNRAMGPAETVVDVPVPLFLKKLANTAIVLVFIVVADQVWLQTLA